MGKGLSTRGEGVGGEGEGGIEVRQVTDLVESCWFGFRSQVLWFIAGLECNLFKKKYQRVK